MSQPTPPYMIDRANPKDLDALVGLEYACFDPAVAIPRRQWQYLLANPRADVLVVRHQERVVADALVLSRRSPTGPTGRIYSIAVTPGHRRRRLGKMLLDECLNALRARGAGTVFLEVGVANPPAIAMYESAGFVKTQLLRDYYAPGQDAWKMRLDM